MKFDEMAIQQPKRLLWLIEHGALERSELFEACESARLIPSPDSQRVQLMVLAKARTPEELDLAIGGVMTNSRTVGVLEVLQRNATSDDLRWAVAECIAMLTDDGSGHVPEDEPTEEELEE